jgi:hypothetical protein
MDNVPKTLKIGKSVFYPTFIYLILLVYDMWMFIKQDNLENAILMVIITLISVVPWVYTLYSLGKNGYTGRAWLLLIPKLFASILGGYLMLKGTPGSQTNKEQEEHEALQKKIVQTIKKAEKEEKIRKKLQKEISELIKKLKNNKNNKKSIAPRDESQSQNIGPTGASLPPGSSSSTETT